MSRHRVQLALRFRKLSPAQAPQAHPTRVSALSGQGTRPLSGRLSVTAGEGASTFRHRFPAAFRPPAFASRVVLHPPRSSAFLTVGPPDANFLVWTSTGLSRSARDRYDRGGCPLYPGDGGALPPGQIPPGGTRRLTAAGPYLPLKLPIGGSANDEASTRLHAIHPSGLPQPVAPGWNGSPWALHPGLRTPRLPTTHAEAGTVPAHWTGHYTIDISRPSFDEYRCSRAA
jgi:hypothetical protein